MVNVDEIVDRYVAVWNENDPDERRRRIHAAWAVDGTTCYRLMDARGYEAIETRVAGSWDKWLREGKYVFRPKSVESHHDVVKVEFVMVTVPGSAVEANGLSFLLLDREGRIRHDYQFNPSANEPHPVMDRYLAVFNETNMAVRCDRIAELWAPDGMLVTPTALACGHDAIAEKLARANNGSAFAPADRCHAHHHVLRFKWRTLAQGEAVVAGTELLVFDEAGRIHLDYRFEEPA